ncbi:MAG TPA: DUF255 domain-containing protein, partial [Candidatus Eisenbacteria bacterium]|nr:DUF255 domain-containing protein [Candidatus Eisenbacteria bacterium]
CHWCRVMGEESYTDSAVVAEIAAHYIPIRVDYDLRPDIGDRYLTNGWPTTGVLSANGHLLLAKTYLPPPDLHQFLAEAVRYYRTNRAIVDRKVVEAERAVERTWAPDSLLPPSITDEAYIDQNIAALRESEDKVNGGFGNAPKTAHWDAISFLLRAADAKRDDSIRALAVRATAAALALQDSVDGGFFRFALSPDWTKIRYERLLDEQAAALSILSRVHRATGEERFKVAAARVSEFVANEMLKRQRAGKGTLAETTWRVAVGPDLRRHDGSWMDGDVYFRLSRGARAKQGALPVSPTCVTDASARMISALSVSRRTATPGGLPFVPLRDMLAKMRRPDGSFFHAEHDRIRSGEGLLADHAALGNALLDAYQDTGDATWLDRSDTLAVWMRSNLEDPGAGGFRYAPRDTVAVGRLRAGDRPERANIEAATFFLRRSWINGRAEDREVAERTSRLLQSGDKIVMDPGRAELALRLRQEPVRLLVIGGRINEAGGDLAMKLRTAAREAPGLNVAVRSLLSLPGAGSNHSWDGGAPPDAKSPAIYRWTTSGWRGPVTDPEKIGDLLDKPVVEP